MNTQPSFLIPIGGLKVGAHAYHFDVDHHFVNKYDETEVSEAEIACDVLVEISTGHIEITVDVTGTIKVPCDRCTKVIDLPIDRTYDLVVKYGDETKEDGEVIYLARDAANLNLEHSVYDLIRLSLPLVNVYDCENDETPPCDQEVLSKLNTDESIVEEESSIWDSLKKEIK